MHFLSLTIGPAQWLLSTIICICTCLCIMYANHDFWEWHLFCPEFLTVWLLSKSSHYLRAASIWSKYRKFLKTCPVWANTLPSFYPPSSYIGWLLSPLTMQVAWCLIGLVSIQASLISCSTCSAKLPFFQKAVEVLVTFWGSGIWMKGIKYLSKHPLPQSSVQKGGGGGGIFSGTYGMHAFVQTG